MPTVGKSFDVSTVLTPPGQYVRMLLSWRLFVGLPFVYQM